MLPATDRLEVDKYLFSFCVYASCCCLFVFRDEVVRWFRKLVETRGLVTEIVFVMGGFSSIFPLEKIHLDSSYQFLDLLLSESTFSQRTFMLEDTSCLYSVDIVCTDHGSFYLHRKSTELNCRICVRQKDTEKAVLQLFGLQRKLEHNFESHPFIMEPFGVLFNAVTLNI